MTTTNENNTEATAPGRRVHYCRCLGRWYGRTEWNRLRKYKPEQQWKCP